MVYMFLCLNLMSVNDIIILHVYNIYRIFVFVCACVGVVDTTVGTIKG